MMQKSQYSRRWILLTLLLPAPCAAQLFTLTNNDLHLAVPDGSPFGVVSSLAVDLGDHGLRLQDVSVALDLSGGWAGDLYVQLTHESGFAVLLNRVGRTSSNPLGYGETVIDIWLADTPGIPDIHSYRETLSGSPAIPVPGGLTGVWASDGRRSDPSLVVETDSRSARLDSFDGLNPNGTWALYLLDQDPGSEFVLNSWSLQFTAVPEPNTYLGVFAGGLLAFGIGRSVLRKIG